MQQRFVRAALTVCLLLGSVVAFASPSERLAEAVRFETVSYQDKSLINYQAFQDLHQYLRGAFPLVFSSFQIETVNDHSLLLRWPGTDESLKPVLFTAHMDVVPIEPGTEQDWQHPPFAGVVADGRIYGRGTLDDKEGMMGLLEAAEQLLSQGFTPTRGLVFAFGHDEEISGPQGATALAARMMELGLQFEWMVDEGGMILEDYPLVPGRQVAMINIAEKGYLTLTLTATGEGGHASRPPVVSTIGRLSAALARIEANPFPSRMVGPVRAMFESLAPHVEQPEKLIFSNLWLTGDLVANNMAEDPLTASYVRTTTALTMFNAGVKENVVPQRAEAKVNFRLLPGDTAESVLGYIEGIVDDPAIEITYDSWKIIPAVADDEGGGFAVIREAVGAVYPDALVVPSLLVATTDTRHYTEVTDNLYRFHGILVASKQGKSIHGTDEYITQDSYLKSIEVARHMLQLAAQ